MQDRSTQTTFTLARVAHYTALLVMTGAIVGALRPFLGLPVALAVGGVLTYVFSRLVHLFVGPERVPWRQRLVAGAAAVVVGVTTTGLTYSAVYGAFFAKQSAVREISGLREDTEREALRVLTSAQTAHAALRSWAGDAAAKAAAEASQGALGGGSCPARPQTRGVRGPISFWRSDDASIAQSLADELGALTQAAGAEQRQLAELPRPTTLAEVRQTLDAVNRLVDAVAPLAGGSAFAQQAIDTLKVRASSLVELPSGERIACGDTARLAYIDRATAALGVLVQARPTKRLELTIDPGDRDDTVLRGWLRGFNGALAIATFGMAGQFADDPLMLAQLKAGVINRESIGFLLSLIAEFCVVATAITLQREGRLPFRSSLPEWVREVRSRPSPSTAQRVLGLLAGQLVNALYAERALAPEAGHRQQILPPDALYPVRETGYGSELAAWHMAWGSRDYLVIPVHPSTVRVRNMAYALRAQGVLSHLTSTASADQLAEREDVRATLADRFGPAWQQHRYEVFAVRPTFAQVLYRSAITRPSEPDRVGDDAAAPSAGSSPAAGLHRAV